MNWKRIQCLASLHMVSIQTTILIWIDPRVHRMESDRNPLRCQLMRLSATRTAYTNLAGLIWKVILRGVITRPTKSIMVIVCFLFIFQCLSAIESFQRMFIISNRVFPVVRIEENWYLVCACTFKSLCSYVTRITFVQQIWKGSRMSLSVPGVTMESFSITLRAPTKILLHQFPTPALFQPSHLSRRSTTVHVSN